MNNDKGAVGFAGLLCLAFIVLKLLGVISWSWLWVLSPLWVHGIILIVLSIIFVLIHIFGGGRK